MPEYTPDGDKHSEVHIGLTSADLAELGQSPPEPARQMTAPEFRFQQPSDVRFEDAAIQALEAEVGNKGYPPRQRELLKAHGLDINPALGPRDFELERFTEEDWANVRNSPTPFLTLLAAGNYYLQDSDTTFIPLSGRRHPDPREGYQGLENQARIETLPLIHGVTAEAFLKLAQTGVMQSNKTRLQQAGQDRPQFHSTSVGTNYEDRQFGLDQYVFFDFARPAYNHANQPEIMLVVDPAVMNQPGTFMTGGDIQDIPPDGQRMHRYLAGVTTPEYFHQTALLQIHNTVTASGESRSGGGAGRTGWSHYNTLNAFMQGEDGERVGGLPTFSTYEVKVPDPPGVPIEGAIGRVIVRDQATFEHLQETLGDQFELVHAQLRRSGGIKPDYEGDARDAAAIDPGNYSEHLQIPGAFERRMEALIETDYRERADALAAIPEADKEQAVVVFGGTDPDRIDSQDVRTRLTSHTNPYRFNDQMTATYDSADALQQDLRATTDLEQFSTAATKPPWFFDPIMSRRRINTSSGSCVVATIERSKENPRITRILNLKPFSLDEQAA